MGRRRIAHVDADAFFASIEIRDRPELVDRPVVVGGSPDGRGVVSTANYVARRYGIRSAMPAAEARRLCPEAVFLPPDFPRYAEASRKMRDIFRRVTHLVEPVGLDEAYLDLSRLSGGEDPVAAMRRVKQEIAREVGVTVSVGLAANKFLAKLASDWRKPDGFTVWDEEEAAAVLRTLPIERVPGVGPRTAERLRALGYATAGAVAAERPVRLYAQLGAWGWELHLLCRGVDDRPVTPERQRKSSGREETFPRDIRGREACLAELSRLAEDLACDLREEGILGQTLTLKVRYADFRTVTRALSLPRPTNASDAIYRAAGELLEKVAYDRPIRLLGLSLSRLHGPGDLVQPSLLDGEDDPAGGAGSGSPAGRGAALEAAVAAVRARYGPDVLRRARSLLSARRATADGRPWAEAPPADRPDG